MLGLRKPLRYLLLIYSAFAAYLSKSKTNHLGQMFQHKQIEKLGSVTLLFHTGENKQCSTVVVD